MITTNDRQLNRPICNLTACLLHLSQARPSGRLRFRNSSETSPQMFRTATSRKEAEHRRKACSHAANGIRKHDHSDRAAHYRTVPVIGPIVSKKRDDFDIGGDHIDIESFYRFRRFSPAPN
jgi:hypothetical protein